MRGHVDAGTVADFREGMLSGRKAARVAAHLSSCPRCADVDAQLTALTTLLAATPVPPMPTSLAARLDAALAAEIARASAPAAAADAPGPAGVVDPAAAGQHPATGPAPAAPHALPGDAAPRHTLPGRAGRREGRSRLSLRLVATTAAVVLLGGGGYAVSRVITSGGTGVSTSSAGASAPRPGTASRHAVPALAPEAAGARGLPVVASGTRYRPGLMAGQVAAVLRRYAAPGATPGPRGALPAVSSAAFPHLAACVNRITGGGQPRLVDIARYGTRPAAVIMQPVAGTSTMRVSVVGTACSASSSDIIATFTLPAAG
jgi:Putative zinc-finger